MSPAAAGLPLAADWGGDIGKALFRTLLHLLPDWLEDLLLALLLLALVTVGIRRLLAVVRASRTGGGTGPSEGSAVRQLDRRSEDAPGRGRIEGGGPGPRTRSRRRSSRREQEEHR
ncbi:hypothetical protein [Streptomyces sp. FIT100]|uniref:hypothetical protein n=1 Tax=Streptomyces sp. FIT100 TaxID=2837956 RepID=UPI0021C8CB17|nr:hypothetical protein [Streptomyces sp. FIT100]UUN25799.1 hypothetical protein KK483_04680 [Streptomyces sp. FIT100]